MKTIIKRITAITIISIIMALAAGCNGGAPAETQPAPETTAPETQQETTTAESKAEETTTEEVTEAKIKVSVTVDGKTTDVESSAGTVEELLKENNITLGEADLVAPAINEEIKDGDNVVVKRVTFEEVSEEEEIPYEVVETYSDSMDYGTSAVSQYGEAGIRKITYTVMYIDGEEISREIASDEVIKDPVSEVIVYGTYVYVEPEPDYEYEAEDEGVYEVSRIDYPNCADGSHGYTEITYSDGSVEYVEY